MAYLVIELNVTDQTIQDLNDKGGLNSGDKQDALNQAANVLLSLASGNHKGTAQLTSRDSTSSISTSGTGSKQVIFSV